MEDKTNNKINKNIKRIMFILIIIFISLYFAGKTGYYENRLSKKTTLTKEAIKQFEKDVELGKEVDLTNYINTNVKEYNNKYSNIGLKISNIIDYTFNEGVSWFLKIIKTLFT